MWILISWLLKKPVGLDLQFTIELISGFILFSKKFTFVNSTVRAKLSCLCNICPLGQVKFSFFGHYGHLLVHGQV